jgi:hypothetical protein
MPDPILVDGKQEASLRFPNFTTQFRTVAEALEHWRNLKPKDREHAVLILQDQRVYQPFEIALMHLK